MRGRFVAANRSVRVISSLILALSASISSPAASPRASLVGSGSAPPGKWSKIEPPSPSSSAERRVLLIFAIGYLPFEHNLGPKRPPVKGLAALQPPRQVGRERPAAATGYGRLSSPSTPPWPCPA